MQISFEDKVVVVIGGTSGINRGVAENFARLGAKVCVASRSAEKVADTVEQLQKIGGEVMGFSADVRDFETLQAGFAQVNESWGEIDVLISGAAGNFPAMVKDMSPNGFKAVADIDLLGGFHVFRAAFDFLKKPGASVVSISAPQAFLPIQAQSHVCAAKAGLDMLVRCLAQEWGDIGVRVNSVVPGPIENTEGMKRLAPSNLAIEKTKASVPLHRLGTVDDIGAACAFLSSPYASYITGVVFPVDGGWSLSGASELGNGLAEALK